MNIFGNRSIVSEFMGRTSHTSAKQEFRLIPNSIPPCKTRWLRACNNNIYSDCALQFYQTFQRVD